MFSHFFIERPIFATVLSLVITLAGGIAYWNLPVAQYPPITPPSISVMCTYPGANAQVVADSVAAPIEQQVNGVENMLYMVSQSNNDGSYALTVTFKPGVNLNFAQVLVQNRIALASPLLPDVVKQAGVITRKRNPDILQVLAIFSPKGRYDQLFLSNFATIKIKDELARVPGIGDVVQFGQQDYSMRLWVDPERLAALNVSASDVTRAVREQNFQVASGHIGNQSRGNGVSFDYTITTEGRLTTAAQFDEIIIRTDADGRKIRIKDVGRAELGARNLDSTSKVNGFPNASLAVWALPDANSIEVAQRVRQKMDQLKKSFPEDIDYVVSLDMTPFMEESIHEVKRTLVEAIILVAIVVLVFLQNWRSAVIPLLAVPVAVVGTFAVMIAIGFSLNSLTLFGLVLAIGIVVDDAIVVVEAVEHHIEHGMTPRRAAHRAMDEVSGPVVAVALVLSAVFIPCAFISGITGQFFRQFALTIAVSTVISAFNSLTLSPALAALLLRPREAKKDWLGRLLDLLLGWFFRLFNWVFARATGAYTGIVGFSLRASAVVLVAYGVLLAGGWWGAKKLPEGYIPNQDQGRFYIAVQLPDAASLQRTQKVADRINALVHEMEGVEHTTEIAGQSFTLNANGSNFGQFFVTFKPFDQRRSPDLSANEITAKARELIEKEEPGASVSIFTPPAVSGLGSASGFKIIIEDRGDLGFVELEKQIKRLIAAANGGRYTLTDESLEALGAQPVPKGVLSALRAIMDGNPPPDQVEGSLGKAGLGDAGRGPMQKIVLATDRKNYKNTDDWLAALKREGKNEGVNGGDIDKAVTALRAIVDQDLTPKQVEAAIEEAGVAGADPAAIQQTVRVKNRSRFGSTDAWAAALEEVAPPEAVLAKLEASRGVEYLTGDRFSAAIAEALNDAGVHDRPLRDSVQNRATFYAINRKVVEKLFCIFRANTPQLYVDLDREQCRVLGVDPKAVFDTLQIYLGSYYVNDFNRFGRTWQVVVQADANFRVDKSAVKFLKVRNNKGEMVPLGAVLNIKEVGGPINIGRYNMYPAAAILGLTKPGVSTGQGIEEMERLCHEVLPPGMAFEWTEINFMQIDAAKNIWNNLIFPLSVVFVFLVLAAQYESWSLPLAVILVVPMCIFGSLTGVWVTNGDINIFTQIGFVVLVGLASKNAILIVEFAKHKHEEGGLSRREATLEACKLRLRPILMTSFAFILGVVPLIVGHGAGAEMRKVLGIAVFSGMLGVTIFGIFLTPVFFYVIAGFQEMPLFSSARGRVVSKALLMTLGIATLGLPWIAARLFGRGRRTVIAPDGSHGHAVVAGPIQDGENGRSTNGTNGVHADTGHALKESDV